MDLDAKKQIKRSKIQEHAPILLSLFDLLSPKPLINSITYFRNSSTLSLNRRVLFRMPHARAVENGRLNRSPESSLRAPPPHQPRLLRVRSSRPRGSRHRAPLSSLPHSIHFTYRTFSLPYLPRTVHVSPTHPHHASRHAQDTTQCTGNRRNRCTKNMNKTSRPPTQHRRVLPTPRSKIHETCRNNTG